MADLDVEKKKNNDWWKWVLGLILLALILWLIFDNFGNDNEELEEVDTTAQVAPFSENEETGNIYVAKF